jgi:hypothetical protein
LLALCLGLCVAVTAKTYSRCDDSIEGKLQTYCHAPDPPTAAASRDSSRRQLRDCFGHGRTNTLGSYNVNLLKTMHSTSDKLHILGSTAAAATRRASTPCFPTYLWQSQFMMYSCAILQRIAEQRSQGCLRRYFRVLGQRERAGSKAAGQLKNNEASLR